MRDTCNVLFYIKRSAPLRSGLVPIMGRITINGQRAQFSTRLAVPPVAWDVGQNRAIGRSAQIIRLNRALDEMRLGLEDCYAEMRQHRFAVSPREVRERFFGSAGPSEGVLHLVRRHNAEFERSVGVSRSRSTFYKYVSIERHLAYFLPCYVDETDIPLERLDQAFLSAFHGYLVRGAGHRKNTVWVYLSALKHILRWGRKQGAVFDDPFEDYRVQNEFVRRQFLTEEELLRLMSLEGLSPSMQLVRDAFLFSCFTGLSFIDLKTLTPNEVVAFNGDWWIETTRHKTGSEVQVRLLDVARAILEKYRTEERERPIFPLPSNSWCNRCLRQLMQLAHIDKRVTFHVARHTFATTLTLSHGMSIEAISRLLGHASIRTTQIYANITRAHLDRELTRLSEQLKPFEGRWHA